MIKCEGDFTGKGKKGADIMCEISGNAELVAAEYATITQALLKSEGGQIILDRAMDIMKKEINEDEEKRRS